MLKTPKCPKCGNDDVDDMRYVQVCEQYYKFTIDDDGVEVTDLDDSFIIDAPKYRCEECTETWAVEERSAYDAMLGNHRV